MKETELKLELTPAAADALVRSDLFATDPAIVRQRSVYFDTPGKDLSAAGFSLRTREAEGKRVQTVKAASPGAAGLFVRPEWERAVDSDLPVLDDTTPIKALLNTKVHEIGPVFEVNIESRIWKVTSEEASFEVVLDRGEVVIGARREAICEVDMELKHGSPSALFSFARLIDAVAPLRLSVLSKAERGFRLRGPVPSAAKAEPILLTSDMRASDAFLQIAGSCLRQFRLNEVLLDRREGEELHQARVALRRLRSAFSLYKAMLEDPAAEGLRNELRWLQAALGGVRDLDVLLARKHPKHVRAKLEHAREEAYQLTHEELASPRARAVMLDLAEWLMTGEWRTKAAGKSLRDELVPDFATSAFDRLRRKVRKRNLNHLDDEARHELRKDTKKLRYASEFFGSLFNSKRQKRRHKRFREALEMLQDHLGMLNDLAVAKSIVGRLGLDQDPAVSYLLDPGKEKEELVEAAAEAHDALADTKRFWR